MRPVCCVHCGCPYNLRYRVESPSTGQVFALCIGCFAHLQATGRDPQRYLQRLADPQAHVQWQPGDIFDASAPECASVEPADDASLRRRCGTERGNPDTPISG